MNILTGTMGQRGWVHALNIAVFALACAFCFNLMLPLDGPDPRVIDLSDADVEMPSTRTLAATKIVGVSELDEDSAIDTTPSRWLEDRRGLGEDFKPKRRYLVPLKSNRDVETGTDTQRCLIAARIVTDGELKDALKEINGTLSGHLRLPQNYVLVPKQESEWAAAEQLAASTGHDTVLILDRLDGGIMSAWLLSATFLYLTLATAAILHVGTLPKPIYVPLAFILLMVGGQFWWIWPKLSPTLSSIEAMVTPAFVFIGTAMLLSVLVSELISRLRRDSIREFRFNLEAQHDDEQLLVGPNDLRLSNKAGVVIIRDERVQSITWMHILSYVDKEAVRGYFTTKMTHLSDTGSPIETTIKTDFEDSRSNYDPANDRLADYRFRVADARAAALAEHLQRNGKVEGVGWSIDRELISIQPASEKKISFSRASFQDCCFIEEEFSIHHADSDLPVRIVSNTPDLLIFGRVLKTLVTDQSIAALESRPEGRVLGRFTSARLFMTKGNMPAWALYAMGYAFWIVPVAASRWLAKHYPEPVAGLAPEYWFWAAFLAMMVALALFGKLRTRHLDLCEKGLRLTRGRKTRLIPWESISDAQLDRRRLTGNGHHASTSYNLRFTVRDQGSSEESITFTWDSTSASSGEITALEKFVAAVGGSVPT